MLDLRAHHNIVHIEIAEHVEFLVQGRLPNCLKRRVSENRRQSGIGVSSDHALGRECVMSFRFVGLLGVGDSVGLCNRTFKESLGSGCTFRDSKHAHAERSRLDSQLVLVNKVDWGGGAEELK